MKLWSKVLTGAAFSGALLASTQADAAMKVPGGGRGFHQGAYIYGSPLIVYFPVEEEDYPDLDASWQWSFGGGYMFTPTKYLKIQVGGAFEHSIQNFDDIDDDDVSGNMIRFMPEVKIGGGNNVIWGYGILGTGLGLNFIDFDPGGDETSAGFILSVGGGVQGAVWRSLFVGGELEFDLGFFEDDDLVDDDFEIHSLGMKAVIGWVF